MFDPRRQSVDDLFWYFASARQEIFWQRQEGRSAPWTDDPILQRYSFTNVYRINDRTSQFLLRDVIMTGEQSPAELFFRVILFKLFNKIATWELLKREVGELTSARYDVDRYDRILTAAMARGEKIYSPAYIMPSGPDRKKHRSHLRLLDTMMRDGLASKLQAAPTMALAFTMLRSYPLIGDFLAYQFLIDLNYSPLLDFSEMDFVVPGPGAREGLRKCFPGLKADNMPAVIRDVCARQDEEFRKRNLPWRNLYGRPMQLIDVQNVFCEVAKYSRAAMPEANRGRTRIKRRYRSDRRAILYTYPAKWKLDIKT